MTHDDPGSSWVPVLLYHRVVPNPPEQDPFGNFVSVKDFEAHLAWLRRAGFVGVSLSTLDRIFAEGEPQRRRGRRVVITFDDGYEDNHRYAWPLLRRYGFGATVFVVTDAIGKASSFDAGAYPADPMLTAGQIREMSQDGVTFGSHTCTHPPTLAALSEAALRRELEVSRSVLEDVMGTAVELFAYPHSRHDERVEAAVRAAGYRLACAGTGRRFSRYCVARIPAHGGAPSLAAAMARRWAMSRIR